MNINSKGFQYLILFIAFYGIFLQWPLVIMGIIKWPIAAICFIIAIIVSGYGLRNVPEIPFLDKFGCLSLIVYSAAVIFICNKTDGIYFRHNDPVDYCMKFPSGKHKEEALEKILNRLEEGDQYFYKKFKGSQKLFAEFCDNNPSPLYNQQLSYYRDRYFRELLDSCKELVLPEDFYDYEDKVEANRLSEIIELRKSLEKGWEEEHLAWSYVCRTKYFHKNISDSKLEEVLRRYLEYHPRGEHAIDVYEFLDEIPEHSYDEDEY